MKYCDNKISKVSTTFVAFLFAMFTFHSCFAGDVISSYYTDNGKYETSNFYANASVSISNDSNSLIKEKVNKYITTGTNNSRSGNAYSKNNKYPLDDNTGSKKIYNTIIIKTKKTNNNSNRKAIPNNYVIDDVYKTNHINEIKNNINKNKITYTNGNKNNIFTKSSTRDSFESKTKSRFAPFAKTTPDGWYVYALGSFAFLSPSNLSIKALDANNNVTNYGNSSRKPEILFPHHTVARSFVIFDESFYKKVRQLQYSRIYLHRQSSPCRLSARQSPVRSFLIASCDKKDCHLQLHKLILYLILQTLK